MPRKSIFEQYMTRKQTGAGTEIKGCPRCSSGGLLLSQLGSGCQVHAHLRSRNPCWKTLSCLYLGRVLARLPFSAWQNQIHFKAASSAEAAKKQTKRPQNTPEVIKAAWRHLLCFSIDLFQSRICSEVNIRPQHVCLLQLQNNSV